MQNKSPTNQLKAMRPQWEGENFVYPLQVGCRAWGYSLTSGTQPHVVNSEFSHVIPFLSRAFFDTILIEESCMCMATASLDLLGTMGVIPFQKSCRECSISWFWPVEAKIQ